MDNTYKSDNIQLCAFLLTQDISFLDVFQDYPNHYIFVLSHPEKCYQLEKDYMNNAVASAQLLFAKREMLISQIKNKNQKGDKYEGNR